MYQKGVGTKRRRERQGGKERERENNFQLNATLHLYTWRSMLFDIFYVPFYDAMMLFIMHEEEERRRRS